MLRLFAGALAAALAAAHAAAGAFGENGPAPNCRRRSRLFMHWAAGIFAVVIACLGGMAIAPKAVAQPLPPWPQCDIDRWWPGNTDASRRAVQRALSNAVCFPDGTPQANPVTGFPTADGAFAGAGSFSHRAIRLFISLKYPGVTSPPLTGAAFLREINCVPVGYRGQTTIIGNTFPPRTCDRRIAERIWPGSRPEIRSLRTALGDLSTARS